MCGRYSLISDLGELAKRYEFDGDELALEPAYNVAPTQDVLTVVGGETRRGGFMRWGLIPWWAKNASIGSRMINARAETVSERPAFRDALRRRRCLVLADGFYEWQRTGAARNPCASSRGRESLRLRRAVVGVEGPGRQPHPVMRHHHDDSQRPAQAGPRPYAGGPSQGAGRSLAGPQHRRSWAHLRASLSRIPTMRWRPTRYRASSTPSPTTDLKSSRQWHDSKRTIAPLMRVALWYSEFNASDQSMRLIGDPIRTG